MFLSKDFWAYMKYIKRHRKFVRKARKLTGSSWWRAIMHDLSKYRLSEFQAYKKTFYKPDGSKQYIETEAFAKAWNYHQKRNPHHYQFWVLLWDRGDTTEVEMPEKYAREMVADWIGAGMAIAGTADVGGWYEKNKTKIKLHPATRLFVEGLIKKVNENNSQVTAEKVPRK